MKSRGIGLFVIAAVVGMLVLSSVPCRAAEKGSGKKAGKKVYVNISQKTKVGDLTLKPGRYMLQHIFEENAHYMHFTKVTPEQPGLSSGGQTKEYAGKAKCTLEPLGKKADWTALHFRDQSGENRLIRVEFAGEGEAHVF